MTNVEPDVRELIGFFSKELVDRRTGGLLTEWSPIGPQENQNGFPLQGGHERAADIGKLENFRRRRRRLPENQGRHDAKGEDIDGSR